jgi:hypothetical protein
VAETGKSMKPMELALARNDCCCEIAIAPVDRKGGPQHGNYPETALCEVQEEVSDEWSPVRK